MCLKLGTYKTSDDSTQIKNPPEPSEIMSLLVFMWIRYHNRALGSPQHRRAESKKNTSKDIETSDIFSKVIVEKDADGVDAVTDAAQGEC